MTELVKPIKVDLQAQLIPHAGVMVSISEGGLPALLIKALNQDGTYALLAVQLSFKDLAELTVCMVDAEQKFSPNAQNATN